MNPANEIWRPIEFDFEYTNPSRYEVSNLGRVRSFNATSDGRILKGSMIEGYRVIKLKLQSPRSPEKEAEFKVLEKEISDLKKERTKLNQNKGYPARIIRLSEKIEKKEAHLKKKKHADLLKRTRNLSLLVHRLVAEYFLPKPSSDEVLIGHLDFDKVNNHVDNLKWMTEEENYEHRLNSPAVIREMRQRKYTHKYRKRKKAWKLDSTKVMHIKMLLKRNRPIRRIAERYGVSETHIRRIQSGENWAHIKIPD